jgi:hypothetical protein
MAKRHQENYEIAKRFGVGRAFTRLEFNQRAAWYLDGYLTGASTEPAQYRFVVVGKDEPHIVSEFEIGPRSLEWGRRLCRRALELFPPCMKPTAVELPAHAEYALADLEAEGAL